MMNRCPQCQWPLASAVPYCPKCGADQASLEGLTSTVNEGTWLAVARVANLAEIGYLADLLEGNAIATQIVQHHDFNAIDGAWKTAYELQVPQPLARQAAKVLREELENPTGEIEWTETTRNPNRRTGLPGWTPVMLVLVAGGLAYCATQVARVEPVRQPAAVRESLWQAIAEDDDPLVTSPAEQGRRRLRFEPATGHVVLEDDLDGDGRVRVRRFVDGRLVKESVQ